MRWADVSDAAAQVDLLMAALCDVSSAAPRGCARVLAVRCPALRPRGVEPGHRGQPEPERGYAPPPSEIKHTHTQSQDTVRSGFETHESACFSAQRLGVPPRVLCDVRP